ncbi:LacI family DNA-binding transcriptional regulator [Peptoniphilaceae bacterium SGI.131]
MSRKPTMEDVKNLAGVSISTVSRVINGTRRVSHDKTVAVERAIEKLGYKPNELARSLVMKRSNTLGIILDDIGIEYMAQFVRGIDEIGKMYRYDILLYSTFGNPETQKKAVEFLSSKQVEGIIVISEKINNEILYSIKEYDIPYLLLDKFYNTEEYRTVAVDWAQSMSAMTDFFIESNHKNVLFLREKSFDYSTDMKQAGYEDTMHKHGLDTRVFTVANDSIDDGYKFMADNFKNIKAKKYTGIMAASDRLAIGVLHYCFENGIKVPEDLSVSGYGNYAYSSIYKPSLTTVRLPYYDIGAVAVRMLIKVLKDEDKFEKTIHLHHEIMVRETVNKL